MTDQMQQDIGAIKESVKSIAKSLDGVRDDMKAARAEMLAANKAHNNRINELELDRARREGDTAAKKALRGTILVMFGGSVGGAVVRLLDKWM